MAIYRKIDVSFWQDSFVMNLTPEEKYFYMYLMTNTKTSQCGIYELPKKIICFETGYNQETVEKLIKRFVDYGKIHYSDSTREVMLVNWIKFNWSDSPKVISRVLSELKLLKNQAFIKEYAELTKQYGYCIDIESQEEEEEEEKEEKEEEEEPPFRLSTKLVEEVRQAWNDLGLSQVSAIKPETKRYINLRTRAKEYGIDNVFKAIQLIKKSDFLQGDNDRGWRIDLGWLLLPNNFPKVLEETYSNRQGSASDWQKSIEEWANDEE